MSVQEQEQQEQIEQVDDQFNGLPMPVFTAFGWAGEEAAIQFSLSKLRLFLDTLVESMSDKAKFRFPFHGVDEDARIPWLAVNRDPEVEPYIAFVAKPRAFEMRISITDPAALNRGLRAAEKNPEAWQKMISSLGMGWQLQIEQRLKEEDAVTHSHYGDLLKDSVPNINPADLKKATSRAAFLITEEKWSTPVFVSRVMTADQAAGMGRDLVKYMVVQLDKVFDIVDLFSRSGNGKSTTSKSKGKTTRKKRTGRLPKEPEIPQPQTFSYTTELKGLHIRKGFVNLTPGHWPFFAEGKRMETRPITISFAGKSDDTSAVWRLQPDDQARLVLGEPAHAWLAATFSPNSNITVNALRTPDDQIEVVLSPAGE